MFSYKKSVVDVEFLTRRLAALSLDDKPTYPEMLSPPKTPTTMFFKRMAKSRSPTMREHGYRGIRSNLGLYEICGSY